ncbi:hypothetical protein RclHR1_08510001, partial [Rhizophagus clarus]
FWDLAKGDAPELSQFALHLYEICINSASVERLWSNMGFLHSKRRNRLNHKKVLGMSQLRTLIQPHKTSDSEDNEYSDVEDSEVEKDDIIQVSDEENEDDAHTQPVGETSYSENDDTINSTEQWVRIIQNWMGMVGEENIDHSGSNEMGPDFIAVDHTIHLANDPLAKWNLYSIFNNSLELPVFVNAMINLDSN